jgi:hypothetical protein
MQNKIAKRINFIQILEAYAVTLSSSQAGAMAKSYWPSAVNVHGITGCVNKTHGAVT